MEIKKNLKANIEKNKSIFFQIGLIITISFIYMAFEWNTEINTKYDSTNTPTDRGDIYEVPQTFSDPPPPPPPPPIKTEILDLHNNEESIEESFTNINNESNENTIIEINTKDLLDKEEEDLTIYIPGSIEELPEFPIGGNDGIPLWLKENTTFPKIPHELGISGTVYVQFVIEKDGTVSDVKTARKVDPYLDYEAIRVIKSMPKWKAGKQAGKPVRVSFVVPINFKIY